MYAVEYFLLSLSPSLVCCSGFQTSGLGIMLSIACLTYFGAGLLKEGVKDVAVFCAVL